MVYNNYSVKQLHSYSTTSFSDKILNWMVVFVYTLIIFDISTHVSKMNEIQLPYKNSSVHQVTHEYPSSTHNHFGHSWSSEAWLYDY